MQYCSIALKNDRRVFVPHESANVTLNLNGLTNNNKFPVTIRQVWQFEGETTQWVEVLQPDQSKPIKRNTQHGYYIYKNEELIGFINDSKIRVIDIKENNQ